MTDSREKLFLWLQYLLPRYLMTRAVFRLARVRHRRIKDLLIRRFVSAFGVNTSEVDARVPQDFETFNAFFTRALKEGARPVDSSSASVVSPVDGRISAAGSINQGQLFQAKGLRYSLDDLLATDIDDGASFTDGRFATIYLAPHNYHRVHAPLAGRLVAMRYVPGDLYSVNQATVRQLPRLFARNERLVCHFNSDAGPFALLFVGALNVGSISTPWTGELRPRKNGVVEEIDIRRAAQPLDVAKGQLLGWFNMGSTVILLLPRGACELRDDLEPELPVRMGETIATLSRLTP